MHYELTPIQPARVGKDNKMSKQAKAEALAKPQISKSRSEHAKDILIAVLITAVIAFIGGMHFANKHNAEMQSAVKAAQITVDQQTAVKK